MLLNYNQFFLDHEGDNMDVILPWEAKLDVLVKKDETTDPSYGCQPEKRSIDEYMK